MKTKQLIFISACLIFQTGLKAQEEIPPAKPVYDSLSPFLNTCGQNLIWDLHTLNLASYTSQENDEDLSPIIEPGDFRIQHPDFNFSDSLYDILPVKSFSSNGINYLRTGTYSTEFSGLGTLKLPTETFNNVSKIKIVENYQITACPSDSICYAYTNTYNYYFAEEILKPVLCYSEKLRRADRGSVSEYYKAISHPAMSESSTLSNLMTTVNFTCTPNPAISFTMASYYLPASGQVKLTLENTTNNISTTIENTSKIAGQYTTNVYLTGLTAGIYYVKLNYQGVVFMKQVIIN